MRASAALAASLAALALSAPATVTAQTPPPDERAAARGFADAAGRLLAADRDIGEDHDPDDGLDAPRCAREIYRIPPRRQAGLRAFAIRDEIRQAGDALEPALAAFRAEIANAQTRDPALIRGRAAWRRLAKAYMALPPRGDVCADLAAWRRHGYPLRTVRAAEAEYRSVFAAFGPGFQRKVAAAADRMRELGVSREDADAFGALAD
jgi:hypothetical protein